MLEHEAKLERTITAAPMPAIPVPTPIPAVLDLAAARTAARQNNPDPASTLANLAAAAARLEQARAAYAPQAAASAGWRHQEWTPSGSFPISVGGYDAISGGLSASWVLYDAFAREYRAIAARNGVEAAAARHDDLLRLLDLAVAQSFFGVLLAEDQAAVAEADRDYFEKILKDARKRRESGVGARAEELSFEIAMRRAESAISEARSSGEMARAILGRLIAGDAFELPSECRLQTPALDRSMQAEADYLLSADRRPDVTAAAAAYRGALANIEAAKAARRPVLAAVASAGFQSQDDLTPDQNDREGGIGLTASLPLADGGLRRAAVAEAEATADAAAAVWQSARGNAIREIREQYAAAKGARQVLDHQTGIVPLAQQARDDVTAAWRAGTTPITRLNEAQRDLTVAEAGVSLAKARWLLSLEQLRLAAGRSETPPTTGAEK